MKKEIYSLKEVILGLRSKYTDNQLQLQDLKNYCSSDSTVGDYSFYMQQFSDNYKEYSLYLQYFMKLKDSDAYFKPAQLLSKVSGIYIFPEYSKVFFDIGCPVKVKKSEEFLIKKEEIINSEFSKCITKNNISAIGMPCSLSTSLSNINAYLMPNNYTFGMNVLYDGHSDKLYFTIQSDTKVNEKWVKEQLEFMLGNNFHRESMSNYMFEAISDCEDTKELNLCDYSSDMNGRTFIFEFADKKRTLKNKNTIF